MTSQLIKKIVTGDEIRNAFLKFYSEKLHKIIPSASLIPDDPTVMLTIAGMLPFKIISKRKITKHFKKSVMSSCNSNVFYIVCSDALLARCSPF